jgi:hypothetical protein
MFSYYLNKGLPNVITPFNLLKSIDLDVLMPPSWEMDLITGVYPYKEPIHVELFKFRLLKST